MRFAPTWLTTLFGGIVALLVVLGIVLPLALSHPRSAHTPSSLPSAPASSPAPGATPSTIVLLPTPGASVAASPGQRVFVVVTQRPGPTGSRGHRGYPGPTHTVTASPSPKPTHSASPSPSPTHCTVYNPVTGKCVG